VRPSSSTNSIHYTASSGASLNGHKKKPRSSNEQYTQVVVNEHGGDDNNNNSRCFIATNDKISDCAQEERNNSSSNTKDNRNNNYCEPVVVVNRPSGFGEFWGEQQNNRIQYVDGPLDGSPYALVNPAVKQKTPNFEDFGTSVGFYDFYYRYYLRSKKLVKGSLFHSEALDLEL